MKILREIAEEMWETLREEERDRLVELGIVPRFFRAPAEPEALTAAAPEPEDEEPDPEDDFPPEIRRGKSRQPRPGQTTASRIDHWLRDHARPSLPAAFPKLAKAGGFRLTEEVEKETAERALQSCLEENRVSAAELWELLSWNEFEGDWEPSGDAARAYRAVMDAWFQGNDAPTKYRWILKKPRIQWVCSVRALQKQAGEALHALTMSRGELVENRLRSEFCGNLWLVLGFARLAESQRILMPEVVHQLVGAALNKVGWQGRSYESIEEFFECTIGPQSLFSEERWNALTRAFVMLLPRHSSHSTARERVFDCLIRRELNLNEMDLECLYADWFLFPVDGLSAARNRIGTFVGFGSGFVMPLSRLNLRENHLEEVPPEIPHALNLRFLDLSRNRLTFLPEEIGELTELVSLDLSHNQLRTLPASLTKLAKVEEIRIDLNPLVSLPTEVWYFLKRRCVSPLLEGMANPWLSMDFNYAFPWLLDDRESLKRWWLDRMGLTEIPPEFLLRRGRHCEEAFLQENLITAVPPEIGALSRLEWLNLAGNRITSLPPETGELKKLKRLDLAGNQLETLPPELGRLENLHSISLQGNPLEPALLTAWEEGGAEGLKGELRSRLDRD